MSNPIPQWLRDSFDRIELDAPKLSGMGVFTQMRTKVQAYFMRFDDQPVAVVDEGDDGMFIDFVYGEDGTPLKMGDKLYARSTDAEIERTRESLIQTVRASDNANIELAKKCDTRTAQLADRAALLELIKVKLSLTPQAYLVGMIDQVLDGETATVAAYRLLTAADVIEATDEYLDDNATTWLPQGPGIFTGRPYCPGYMVPIRRRLVEEAQS